MVGGTVDSYSDVAQVRDGYFPQENNVGRMASAAPAEILRMAAHQRSHAAA